jgi:hypothetical protein
MAVASLEKQPRQGQTLARRPQSCGAKQLEGVGEGARRVHERYMGLTEADVKYSSI